MSDGSPRLPTFVQARRMVEEEVRQQRPTRLETVALLRAQNRVLGEEIRADRDFPPFDRSTRDGYAVLSSDVAKVPARLQVVGEVKAGSGLSPGLGPIGGGRAAAIMTGAPLPPGADAVVMVEHTSTHLDEVEIRRSVAPGENVVATGAEGRRGQLLLPRGTRLGYPQIALAAAVGKEALQVHQLPRVAIISTGDEVVDISAQPAEYQIRNSNSYALAAQVHQAGGEPVLLPIAPDESGRLEGLVAEGLRADLLLLSGGVSMGKYDLVEGVLRHFKAEFLFTGARIQPGKPVVFGRATAPGARPHTYFLGLPGNPLSTMVTFELFARPAIEVLSGCAASGLVFTEAALAAEFRCKPGLTRFLPGIVGDDPHKCGVTLVPWQGSGDMVALAKSNCYVVVPPERELILAGERVRVLLRG